MKFEKIEDPSHDLLLEVIISYLSEGPDLQIIADRISLQKEDPPFLIVLNGKEKRIGIVEILDASLSFPSQILMHAAWLDQNRYAIANLKKEEFNPNLSPFIIALVSIYPNWINLCSYIRLELTLLKYNVVSYQGKFGLIVEPIIGDLLKKPVAENRASTFHDEEFDEMGLSKEELRFFSS